MQAVVEVLPELSGADSFLQVHVCCGHHPHVEPDRLATADPLDASLLQYPEELRLELHRQVADLVQEQRTSLRHLESAGPCRGGPGERAFLVAEELALDQVVGEHRAIHCHERPAAPLAGRMDRPSEELLARTSLAEKQHVDVGYRELERQVHGLAERGALSDERRCVAANLAPHPKERLNVVKERPVVERLDSEVGRT